ncbi:MAG: NAD(+) diphosphatase [Acidimicrobiales bacterium]
MFVPLVNHADHDWRAGASDAKWLVVDGRSNVLLIDGAVPVAAQVPLAVETVHLLGLDGTTAVWAVDAAEAVFDDDPGFPDQVSWVGLRQLYGAIDETDWVLAGRAAQVVTWDRDHRFCGRCGEPTTAHWRDRARECRRCRLLAYPRLNPAVIMLVERDDGRALLAWGRQFPGRFFSALAGFVEPGESLEEAVAREVQEEVGITIDDIRYFGSQPWPFPHSMMIGFTARYRSGELVYQEDEIVEAGWYTPDDLPPVPRGGMSIAGWMIEDWINRSSG